MTPLASKDKVLQAILKKFNISDDKYKKALEKSRHDKKSIFVVMAEDGIVDEESLYLFLSEEMTIPVVNLHSFRIGKELIREIPKKLAERYQVVPFSRIGNLFTIATCDPFDLMVRDDLKEVSGSEIIYVLVTPKAMLAALDQYYGGSTNLEEIMENLDDHELEVMKDEDSEGLDDALGLVSGAEDAPVVKMVDLILARAIQSRCSDIHFEPYEKNFRVRFRIDGALKETFRQNRDLYGHLVARMKIMSQLNITEKRLPQDGRFRIKLRGKEIDFRVSILPIYHGEKMVLRVLDKSGMKSGLDQLGFSEKPTDAFSNAIQKPYGMILVTGPTGSGKSTTLYTILNTMNTPDRNIMTIEDPVEYQVNGITQTQTKQEVGLNFASGLRCLLRQSPDIILVGEIRDVETADIAVKAALTGHLVFSTLHTNSAAGGFTRLSDMGVEPFLVSSSVIAIAAQRLLRKVCQYCKERYEVPDEVLRRCGVDAERVKKAEAYHGKGCAKCNNTGYFGRAAVIEVLTVDSDIRELIIKNASSDVIHEMAVKKGMETLFENAFGLFERGVTTLEEVLRIAAAE